MAVVKEKEPPKFPIQGDRMVDVEHMAKSMYCSNTNCNEKLHLENIKGELIFGQGSFFKAECPKCYFLSSIESGPMQILPGNSKKTFVRSAKLAIGKYLNIQ